MEKLEIGLCLDCQEPGLYCLACGACSHEKHSEKCRAEWRAKILSY